MANDLEVKLKISADGVQAKGALKDVSSSLIDLNKSADLSAQGIDAVGKSSEQTAGKVGTLDTAAVQADSIFAKFGNTLKEITNSGLNFLIDHAIHGLIMLTARTALFGVELKAAFGQEKEFADASRMFEGTSEEINKLNSELKDLAVKKIPVPYEEIAHLAKIAGSMGVVKEEVSSFITTASEAALSFNTPAEELMQSLGGIQTALKLTNDELPTFTDQVKSAADSASGMSTEAGIMSVLADGVAQAGREIGLTAGETVAFSSAMLNVDGNVQNTSSSLFGLFLSFKNAKGQSKEFQNSLVQLGTSADQFASDIKANPEKAITSLLEKLKTFEGESKLDIIAGLVGQNQTKQGALLNLTSNLDGLQQQLRATSDETVYAGGVHDAYLKKLETTDAKLEFMSNAFKLLAGAIANPFLPAVKLAVDAITDLTNWFRKATENNPLLEILQKSTFLFLGLGGSIHLVSLFFAPVIAGLGLMMRSFATTAPLILTTTSRIYGYIASLKAMAVAQIAAFSSGTTAGFSFAGMLTKVGAGIRIFGTTLKWLVGGTFGLIGIGITTLVVSLSYLSDQFSTVGETSAKNSEIAWAAWSVFLKNVTEGVQPVIDAFNELSEWVSVATGGLRDQALSIGSAFDILLQKILPFYGAIKSAYAYLENMGAVKKFKIDVEEEIKQSRTKEKAKPSGRAADTGTNVLGMTGDAKAEAKKTSDELEKIAKETQDRQMKTIRDGEAEKIRLYTNTGASKKQIDDFSFQQKLLTEQQITALITMNANNELASYRAATDGKKILSSEELASKRSSLLTIETAYKTQIANLIALEQQHRDKALGFFKELADRATAHADKLREFATIGMNAEQVNEQRKRELVNGTAQVKKLIAAGEFEEARVLSDKLMVLAEQDFQAKKKLADETNKAKPGYGDDNAAKQALDTYNQLYELGNKAIAGSANAANLQADIAKKEADKQVKALEEISTTIDKINNDILTVKVDSSEVSAATDAINAIPKDVYTTVHTQTAESHAAGGWVGATRRAVGGFIRGAGSTTGDKIRAWLSDKEYVVKASSVASLGVGTMDYINQTGQLPAFAAGGAVANHISQIRIPNMNMVTPSGAGAGKSMGTFDINLSAGGSTARVTGENTPALQAVIAALQQQKRATR